MKFLSTLIACKIIINTRNFPLTYTTAKLAIIEIFVFFITLTFIFVSDPLSQFQWIICIKQKFSLQYVLRRVVENVLLHFNMQTILFVFALQLILQELLSAVVLYLLSGEFGSILIELRIAKYPRGLIAFKEITSFDKCKHTTVKQLNLFQIARVTDILHIFFLIIVNA